jgi:hypothetical protein
MNFARGVAAAAAVACLGACSPHGADGDGGTNADGAVAADARPLEGCAALSGNRFASVSMLECGPSRTDGGAILCYWHLNFDVGGTFYWQHSDYAEQGTYRCDGNDVTGTGAAGETITGRWTPASARLAWAGQDYKLEAPIKAPTRGP